MDEDPTLMSRINIDHMRTHEDNPFNVINIFVKNYHSDADNVVVEFMIQLLGGYIWACKNDTNFIAVHDELRRVEQLYNKLISYRDHRKKKNAKKRAISDFFGENFVSMALTELAVLLPYMWD